MSHFPHFVAPVIPGRTGRRKDNQIFILHSGIRMIHVMFIFSHPLKPTEDWTFSILYFVSEHWKIILLILCPFQTLPIKESLQSPSSFRSSLVETRQELHPRVVCATSTIAAELTLITTKFSSLPPFGWDRSHI